MQKIHKKRFFGVSRVYMMYNPCRQYTSKICWVLPCTCEIQPMQKIHRNDCCVVLWHWRVLRSRGPPVYMLGTTHAEKTQEKMLCCFATLAGGHGVLPCTCEI